MIPAFTREVAAPKNRAAAKELLRCGLHQPPRGVFLKTPPDSGNEPRAIADTSHAFS
jgi:hypothetical protein